MVATSNHSTMTTQHRTTATTTTTQATVATKTKRKRNSPAPPNPNLPKKKSPLYNQPQNRYAPDPADAHNMTREEVSAWRKEQRRRRNRDSAAASRIKTRKRIAELEGEAEGYRRRCEEMRRRMGRMEGMIKALMKVVPQASLATQRGQQQQMAPPFRPTTERGVAAQCSAASTQPPAVVSRAPSSSCSSALPTQGSSGERLLQPMTTTMAGDAPLGPVIPALAPSCSEIRIPPPPPYHAPTTGVAVSPVDFSDPRVEAGLASTSADGARPGSDDGGGEFENMACVPSSVEGEEDGYLLDLLVDSLGEFDPNELEPELLI